MFRRTSIAAGKRKTATSALISKQKFFTKRNQPGTKKQWIGQGRETEGTIDIAPNFDVLDVAENPSVFDPTSPDHNPNVPIPPPAPLALPSDYSVFHSRLRALRDPRNSSFSGNDEFSSDLGKGRTTSKAELMRKLNRNEITIDSFRAADSQLKRLDNDPFYAPTTATRRAEEGADSGATATTSTASSDVGAPPPSLLRNNWVEQRPGIGTTSSVTHTLSEALSAEQQQQHAPIAGDAVMAASLAATSRAGALVSAGAPQAPPLATIPMGKQLKVEIQSATTHATPMPSVIDHLGRSKEERAESVKVPKNLNSLFHKIMGWNDALAEMRQETALRGGIAATGASVPFGSDEEGGGGLRPQMEPTSEVARREYKKMSEKLRYGALLEEYDKDQFALENKLSVAGLAFEQKFTDWAAIQVVDNAAQQDMEDMARNKASMLVTTDVDFKIPQLNHDCCKGCGSTFQDTDNESYGYVKPGRIERYIQNHSEKVKRRCEYGDRMAELHAHWEKNGRRVGEEWLDFMTQDEFDAIYKYVPRPMVCDRCSVLHSKKSGLVSTMLMSAPDFKKELQPLREKRCVVVLVCDITDFPGSMVYDLPSLVSMNNPVILVLNKLDCIQCRGPNYGGASRTLKNQIPPESYIRQWAKEIATQFRLPGHRIKSIIPVSARRNWNIKTLVDEIERLSNINLTDPTAPVLPTYFVGVSNVGKSSLINSIANVMYTPQPPHPLSKRLYFFRTDSSGKQSIHWRWYTPPDAHRSEMLVARSSKRNKHASNLMTVSNLPGTTIATTGIKISLAGHDKGAATTHLFDTPGLHPHWQATSPLSLLDVRRSLQFSFRNPETFIIKQGVSLLFAGVAAIDVVKATSAVMFCVYSSSKAGHAIVNTDKADEFWAEHLGTRIGPPMNLEQLGDKRLTARKSYLFECYGRHRLRPKADIYFCGLGWVSFMTSAPDDIVLRVRTLPGIVHGVREPLRINDITSRGRWPKVRNEMRLGDNRIPRLNTIIKLTNKEVDLEEEPVKPIVRTVPKSHATGSDAPFDEMMEELSAIGKI